MGIDGGEPGDRVGWSLAREFRRRVAEHEALLTFNDDEDAVLWHEWWHDDGEAAFVKYREQSKEDSDSDSRPLTVPCPESQAPGWCAPTSSGEHACRTCKGTGEIQATEQPKEDE